MARARQFFLIILVLALVLFAMLFTLNNQQAVALDFLVYRTPEASVALWLVLSLILGGIVGALAASFAVFRARHGRRKAEKQLHRSEKSLKRQQRESPKGI